ncbi:MAG: phosphopentomutase, partial [Clostridia bacterium]|nr:phosphopentomutase [Clostridia bacterium]
DAADYGDTGSNTLGNIVKQSGGIHMPNLARLGLSELVDGINSDEIVGAYGKSAEIFPGKDTTGGHFEIAGLILEQPFPVFKKFPRKFIKAFEKAVGRKTIANYAASGTEIIKELGKQHVDTGDLIVYTSADSVFQIAMHEGVIPIDEQYRICEIARAMLVGKLAVGRVICRPFVGEEGAYTRTTNRKDYSFEPPGETILSALKSNGLEVAGVGKIEDIFANVGLTKSNHTTDNDSSITATIEYMNEDFDGLVFTNLVDFDMLYGHRNNVEGYKNALEAMDARVPEILEALGKDDIVLFTADHGCDPTTPSTDHSREYIPILAYGNGVAGSVNIGIRESFADIAATVADFFELNDWNVGQSLFGDIKKG